MSTTQETDSVTVHLRNGAHDGETREIHARTAEKKDTILVMNGKTDGSAVPVPYLHHRIGQDNDYTYIPEFEITTHG